MPTLIRLIVVLLVLGGLGFGAMLALVMTVHPTEKDVTIRIPTRDLMATQNNVERRVIDTSASPPAPPESTAPGGAAPAGTASDDASAAPDALPPPQGDGDAPDVQTLAPGVE